MRDLTHYLGLKTVPRLRQRRTLVGGDSVTIHALRSIVCNTTTHRLGIEPTMATRGDVRKPGIWDEG